MRTERAGIRVLLGLATLLVASLSLLSSVSGVPVNGVGCPFLNSDSALSSSSQRVSQQISTPVTNSAAHLLGLTPAGGSLAANLDFDAVAADIKTLLTNSQSFWPADFGNYGPFFIRQAWHCAGSYRNSDGRGGCDGGRQRFNPELSWADNTNLDKAKTLLAPIKEKYGAALSWGDLIILTGDVAISSMNGPILGFCGGRIDDWNGDASILLGPTTEQAATFPCAVNGDCKAPLGPTTIGLIYVNPEGPMGQPIPEGSAPQIRDTFGRMGMNDYETVALIGGGHAFGKAHGACPLGAGPSPLEQPLNPWPGNCGSGRGADTFTAGFEGSWTSTPTQWSNEFFYNLLNYTWVNYTGPGGHQQWKPTGPDAPDNIMMLTSDISLTVDPAYRAIVTRFKDNVTEFSDAFMHAWYKLVTRDMGPVSRCLGNRVPPPQPFQNPLPPSPPPQQLVDFGTVKAQLRYLMNSKSDLLAADMDPITMQPTYRGYFVDLAFQCAATFRQTDYLGGCNGARIRFEPQSSWTINSGLQQVIKLLSSVKDQYVSGLSWSDLIVLAGNVALEDASNGQLSLPFCGGRTDALPGDTGSEFLSPWDDGNFNLTVSQINEFATLLNMSAQEVVLLSARIRSPTRLNSTFGFSGSFPSALTLSTDYFQNLTNHFWLPITTAGGKIEYISQDEVNAFFTTNDIQLKQEPNYRPFVEYYAALSAQQQQQQFYQDFGAAWTKLMTADRFAGPGVNLCDTNSMPIPSNSGTTNPDPYLVGGVSVAATIVACALIFVCYLKSRRSADSSSYHIQP